MTIEQRQQFLEHLKHIQGNKVAVAKLGERIASMSGDELMQCDQATVYTLLEAVTAPLFELTIRSGPAQRANTRMASESTDPDELLDEYSYVAPT